MVARIIVVAALVAGGSALSASGQQAATSPTSNQGSAIEDAAAWQSLQAMFGRRLNDNSIQLLASARQEPIELRIARGAAGMFLGKTTTIDQGLIDALLSAERATVEAESKVPDVFTARLDLRLLQLRQLGGPSGLSSVEASQTPDAAWASEMVRIACLVQARTSPEVLAARSRAKELSERVLPTRADYVALFDGVADAIQRAGASSQRVKLYNDAKAAGGCK